MKIYLLALISDPGISKKQNRALIFSDISFIFFEKSNEMRKIREKKIRDTKQEDLKVELRKSKTKLEVLEKAINILKSN